MFKGQKVVVVMLAVFLGAALLGLGLTIRYRQLIKIRFGLVLVLTLWAEYSLVFGIGRYSLDTVPVLALVFGIGIDAWMKQKVGGNQMSMWTGNKVEMINHSQSPIIEPGLRDIIKRGALQRIQQNWELSL